MRDYLPAIGSALLAFILACAAAWRYIVRAYREAVERGTREADAIVARADAYYAGKVGASNGIRREAIAWADGVRACVPALVAASWRPPREPVAVEVVAAREDRDTPVSGQPRDTAPGAPPPPFADWPDLHSTPPVEIEPWFTLDDPPSGRRAIRSPLAHSVTGELVPFRPATCPIEVVEPSTPKEPTS